MTNDDEKRIGFIGLGDIGFPMAMRLHQQGHKLAVWNRNPERSRPFAEIGVHVANSAAELAGASDIICLCLAPTVAIEQVVFGPAGVTRAKAAPRLVIDHSTISPDETRAFAERLRSQTGTAWLDAPVSGGPAGARAGTLAVMAGGGRSDFEIAEPILQSLGHKVTHVGELGMGQLAKACNQIVGFITTAAIAEGLGCAQAAGLPGPVMAEIMVGGLADSAALAEYRRATAAGEPGGITGLIEAYIDMAGGFVRPEYAGKLDILHKDMAIAKRIASSSGRKLGLLEQVEAMGSRLNYQ
jgi:3-hydroxyisobutyrate dehydrogenase-like beta-hydroxyacid dehydrogenase